MINTARFGEEDRDGQLSRFNCMGYELMKIATAGDVKLIGCGFLRLANVFPSF